MPKTYAPSVIDNFYPTGPSELENVCLYDFVAHYKYDGTYKMVNVSTENCGLAGENRPTGAKFPMEIIDL